MALTPSPPVLVPRLTIALKAMGRGARGASFPVNVGGSANPITIDLSHLPPGQEFGSIGSVFVDNSNNAAEVFITFPDTNAIVLIPGNGQQWLVGLTGGLQFQVSCVSGSVEIVNVQVVNFLVSPTSSTSVTGIFTGAVTVTSGNITVLPTGGLPTNRSAAAVPITTDTLLLAANAARKYLLLQFPPASDGWLSLTGAAAGPNLTGCVYCQSGEKFQATQNDYVPQGNIRIYLNGPGGPFVVPVLEA